MKTPISIFGRAPVVPVLLLVIFSLATGCSSDDDEGGGFSPPATVPDQLNYEISQGAGSQLSLTQNPSLTITSTLLTGTFNLTSEAFTLNPQPVAMVVSADEFLDALDTELSTDIEENVDFGNYSLHVISTVSWVGDGNPTSGELDIRDDPDPVRKITVRVNPDADGQGNPGVDIILTPASGSVLSTSVTWEQLDGLLDDTNADAYARIASFAYSLLRFMYEQGELVILALEFLDDNDVTLEDIGSVEESCDTFPRPADDLTVINPGTSTVLWSDASGDNSLGPGDTFFLDFIDCWDDDPADTIDTLYDGSVIFRNYTEVSSDGVITRVGFEPSGGPGGIDFPSLRITETEDDGFQILIFGDETITLTGGFSMVFTSP